MSLKETLEAWIAEWHREYRPESLPRVLAGLIEGRWYLVPLADLSEPVYAGGNFHAGDTVVNAGLGADHAEGMVLEAVAIHRAIVARESEAAVLARRRDELAQYFFAVDYDMIDTADRAAIESIIHAEDRAAAAEAEVARLKGEAK